MISYDPLWKTMKQQGISTYKLIHEYDISSRTIYDLKHGKGITLYTLEKLCDILQYEIADVVKFEK